MKKPRSTRILSDRTIARLEAMGWEYTQTGPNEFDWLKFSPAGGTRAKVIARGGDEVWRRDLLAAPACVC